MRKSAESADGQNAEGGGLAEKGRTSSRGGSKKKKCFKSFDKLKNEKLNFYKNKNQRASLWIFTSIVSSIDHFWILNGLGLWFPRLPYLEPKLTKLKVRDKGERREKREKEGVQFLTCCGASVNGWALANGLAAENPTPAETDFPYQACRRRFPALQKPTLPFFLFLSPFSPLHYLLRLTTLTTTTP